MNKTMFAAILSVGMLLFGVIATAYEVVPNADALKSRGSYIKDTSSAKNHKHATKVCGDKVCTDMKDATYALRKGQTNRDVPR